MITRCNLCGSTQYYLVYKSKKSPRAPLPEKNYTISESHLEKPDKIVRCRSCGLTYAVPKESLKEITGDYADMTDPEYLKEERGRRLQARLILAKIAKFKKHGRLLDIGCGPGFFLDEAKKLGWEVQGADLSEWVRRHNEEQFGIPVFRGHLSDARFADQTFDVIVMNDVIEHLTDPQSVLKEIRRILKNGGVLYISTPDIDSVLSRLLRAKWWGINKYHLFYFSKKTLERFFEIAGFKSVHYSPYPRIFSMRYWLERLQSYPKFVQLSFQLVSKIGNRESLVKIYLHDQLGVIAVKVPRLDSVITDEPKDDINVRRQKVTAVLPAYNAEKTLKRTVEDISRQCVDEIILVDDASRDGTVKLAKNMGLIVYEHEKNRGYGGNQKTCYAKAIERGTDIVVMCHPDYQYDPTVIPDLIRPILRGQADAVFGSRMMKGGALEGGMPLWKHNANILLTAFENVVLGTYLTEYHSGFRAYSAKLLERIPFELNSDGFIFDTEIIAQIIAHRFKIEEIPIRTRYFEEASSIKLWPSILYGFGIIRVMAEYFLHAHGIIHGRRYDLKEKNQLNKIPVIKK